MDLMNDTYAHTDAGKTYAHCAMGIASLTGTLPLQSRNFNPEQYATRADLASSIAGLKQQLFEVLQGKPDGFKDIGTAQMHWS